MALEGHIERSGLLTDKSNEFSKLDHTDRMVCLDIMENNPGELAHYVGFVCSQYRQRRIEINASQLLHDIEVFLAFTGGMDSGKI